MEAGKAQTSQLSTVSTVRLISVFLVLFTLTYTCYLSEKYFFLPHEEHRTMHDGAQRLWIVLSHFSCVCAVVVRMCDVLTHTALFEKNTYETCVRGLNSLPSHLNKCFPLTFSFHRIYFSASFPEEKKFFFEGKSHPSKTEGNIRSFSLFSRAFWIFSVELLISTLFTMSAPATHTPSIYIYSHSLTLHFQAYTHVCFQWKRWSIKTNRWCSSGVRHGTEVSSSSSSGENHRMSFTHKMPLKYLVLEWEGYAKRRKRQDTDIQEKGITWWTADGWMKRTDRCFTCSAFSPA